MWRTMHGRGEDAQVGGKATRHPLTPGNPTVSLVPGAGADGDAPPSGSDRGADPYTGSLEELVRLLRIYAAHRGVRVNHTYDTLPAGIAAAAGLTDSGNNSQRDAGARVAGLQLPGVELLHGLYGDGGEAGGHLSANWVLDEPEMITAEQETYVERYLVPTQAEVELTPLRVISSYYSMQGSRSLHRMAADTEKAMNGDGYAKYIQRSRTFYDVSHAARRGYGQEGSIFVAVPFTLTDITAAMVDTIRRRASTVETSSQAQQPASSSPLEARDDGFHELRFTAARCAMTVESLFRQAHRGVAVTVGTLDVVTVSGVSSAAELDFSKPSNVTFPLRAEDRAGLPHTRRYSRITCEPPDFASGWDDASYGFRWKDNLRRRRVVVPLTQLDAASAAQADLPHVDGAAAALERYFAFPYVGNYATLQLYRGESYVFFLRTGSLALPNWDLKLRLLYLRTPARNRAVLSSRPTPRVAWTALAASVAKMWDTEPFLRLSLATASRQRNGEDATGDDMAVVATAPPPDKMGSRLLAALPADVSSWLIAARTEAELVLWLVTPSWLWPTMVETLAAVRQLAASPDSPPPATASSALRLLFASDAVRGVLGDGLSTLMQADLNTVQVDPVRRSEGAAAAAASPRGQRVVNLRGGKSPTTNNTSQAVLSASLTASEVYELLFLAEKRPPMQEQPVVRMPQSESTIKWVPSSDSGAAAERLCGEATSEAPYYSVADKALLKRSFEYCWLKRHRKAVRQRLNRLVHATTAATVLKATPGTKASAAGAAAAAKCSRKRGFVEAEVVPRSSVCLADMRYLEPMETTWLAGAGGGTLGDGDSADREWHAADLRSPRQENSWFTSAVNAGKVHGVATAASLVSQAADGTEEPQLNSPRSPKDAASTPVEPTPYVLQAVASSDLLFGPAEVFFEFDTEHQLRTGARSLSEQLAERRLHRQGLTATAAHARVPEAVELDPSLQFMDSDLEDVYMTQALWTRGWNIFGLTEPVAVGTGEEELSSSASATAPTSSSARDDGPCTVDEAADGVPSELSNARTFTQDKFWALVMAHRDAGTLLGATAARNHSSTPPGSSPPLYPLRRTMKEWELFADMQLTTLRDALRSP
ncbi:conserved hypothetical protein [Leishmania major strain Friedlin]|uniref:Uncharacterized protein n=1 Tax=Leishmania major TaxID=5664 RepID=E9ACA0_LEIMA|nr:conserved hypothetical protein [Leishmania major strain Friedlin]CAG9567176.1 hypothetical_protein_-_conserved [Leishmania major strain Friedlin]CBZ11915.1 conserved hypothetical protein [Leishmania major strain Friedlin]|eukprot:XP_003721631.1 conserved hypothetical protein [Leishmania major strain Friedlin]